MPVPASRILKIAAVLLACAAAAALGWKYFLSSGPQNSLTLYGNVDIRQVDVGFRVGGRIAAVLVDEGDTVHTGDVLAKLDADLLTQSRDQAAAALAGQQAQLLRLESGYRSEEVAQARAAAAAAQAQANNAQINLRRVQAMRRTNAIAQKELDNAVARDLEAAAQWRSALDNLHMLSSGYREEDILAQRAAVQAAEAQLAQARTRLEDALLRAPQEGIVLTRAREAGAIVQEGQTVYTLTLTDPTWLRVYVAEPQLGLIKPGMPVQVRVDAAPGKSFPGTVGFISPTAEFTPKSVETREVRTALVYRLRIQVQDPENIMRQGMPVTVIIPLTGRP